MVPTAAGIQHPCARQISGRQKAEKPDGEGTQLHLQLYGFFSPLAQPHLQLPYAGYDEFTEETCELKSRKRAVLPERPWDEKYVDTRIGEERAWSERIPCGPAEVLRNFSLGKWEPVTFRMPLAGDCWWR